MTQFKTLAVGLTLAIASVGVFAQAASSASTPRADKRQTAQQARIDKGVASGKLTEREAARLEKEQALVGKVEDKAKADGTVTNKERAVIHHTQKRTSRAVARQKADAQKAASAP
jgi:hypothetical protein